MKATGEQDQALSKIDEEIEDVLTNIKSVYANNQIPEELDRLQQYETAYSNKYMDTIYCTLKTRFISIIILGLMLAFVAYRSYIGIKNKTMTAGTFVAIFIILTQWFSTLSWLIDTIRDVTVHWGIVDAYEKMVRMNMPDDKVTDFISPIKPPTAGVLFYDLEYSIKNKQILKHILYYIPPGARVALTGEIGSGKSTLLKLMLGLMKPSNGEIFLDGKPVSKLDKKELRSLISYSPQNPILFNRSIYENITYGIKGVTREKVTALVKEMNIDGLLDLNKLAGKGGSALSGGQRQMVSLMRVMLINPKYIVLDEITSSIDSVTKQKLFNILERLFVDKTVIMVTHDDDMLKLANLHLQMVDGKLKRGRADGS
jgi:ABC-type multidrug transport system fused ATPase/permease subunit